MRDRAATRAFVLGLLSLPFGIFAPFAIWSGARSLRRIRASNGELRGSLAAVAGLVAGVLGLSAFILGTSFWLLASS
jgi:hypothetical protein